MFLKSKQLREFQLQSELDRYAAEIEELTEIADANENRAFAECYRSEWNYWRRLKQGLLELRSKYMDHARGGSDYWLRVLRVQLEGFRRVGPYGRWISHDDDGQPRTNPHNVKGSCPGWYVPDPDPEAGPERSKPFHVQISHSSDWLDGQSFKTS